MNESLHLETLRLLHFKNYEDASLTCSSQLNAFVGLNGMGKTNLLEAIYYLCMCRSPRAVADRHLPRRGSDFFRLEGLFRRHGRQEAITAKLRPGKKKTFERNGKPYDLLSEHIGLLPVVFIAPEDTQLITGGSEERRRLLDNTLSQLHAEYLQQLITYNKVLDQRNRLLKQFAEQQSFDAGLLDAYDRQLWGPADYLYRERERFLADFNPLLIALAGRISSTQDPFQVRYRSPLQERSMADCLRENRDKDRLLARTTAGIHKDDLDLLLDDSPVKRYASQGQTKSLALGLKLAQYRMLQQGKNTPPILLLDDLFDKLDAERVGSLLALLREQAFGQVFLTDTDEARVLDLLHSMGAAHRTFRIQDGTASPIVMA